MSPLIPPTPPAERTRALASTRPDARSSTRPRSLGATVVEPAQQDERWAVRIEIVASERPGAMAGAGPQSIVVSDGRVGLARHASLQSDTMIVDEPTSLASATRTGEALLSAPLRFGTPDPRRAIAAYGAQLAFQDRSATSTGQRLRVRA